MFDSSGRLAIEYVVLYTVATVLGMTVLTGWGIATSDHARYSANTLSQPYEGAGNLLAGGGGGAGQAEPEPPPPPPPQQPNPPPTPPVPPVPPADPTSPSDIRLDCAHHHAGKFKVKDCPQAPDKKQQQTPERQKPERHRPPRSP